jgi:hypothetical protein
MITLKDFMETVDYKVTEGSDYCWNCYGDNAYRLDSWNQDQEGHSISIVFDTRTHVVYEVSAYDYTCSRAYRLINPDYKSAFEAEAAGRGVMENQAWDDVNYVDLETDEDFLGKAQAIVAGEDYDTRVSVPVDFTDEELLTYMKLAHDRDITFNQFVETALQAAIDEHTSTQSHLSNTDNPIDFPVTKKKSKKKSKK